MTEADAFQKRLLRFRKKRDLTQGQLAIKSGVEQSYISKIERGESSPTIDVAARLARALDVSLDWLCGLPPRTPGELTPDEAELLHLYRSTRDEVSKEFILDHARMVAKRYGK